MSQVVPGVVEIRMQYKSDGEKCENVYHVEHGAGEWSETDLEHLATLFLTWEDEVGKLHRSNEVVLYQVIATDLTSLSGFRLVIAPDIPPVGFLTGQVLPNNATLAVHADIGTRGRGKSGRIFFIGLNELDVDGNSVDAGLGGFIEDDLNTLRTRVQAADVSWHMCVPHRVVGNVRPPSASFTDIRSWGLTDFSIDSQKLRLPFHKKHKRRVLPV